jgi:hypothetical protein
VSQLSDIILHEGLGGPVIDAALPISQPPGVVLLHDEESWIVRNIPGEYLFNGACTLLVDDAEVSLNPANVYETDDYYCRVGITVTVDAADPSPLMASLINYGQMMALHIQAKVCGEIVDEATGIIDYAEPPQLFACGVAAFHDPKGGIFVMVDGGRVAFPLRVYMTITAEGFSRSGYIQIRAGSR